MRDSSSEQDLMDIMRSKLAEGLTIFDAASFLEEEHGVSHTAAMALAASVVAEWANEDKKFSPYNRSMQRRRLMKMREDANMKELVQIEKQLKELDDAQGHKGDEEEADLAEIIASKTDEEIAYYEEHGHWEDEAPQLRD